mmetsp:Transcript_11351/g.27793  ORF Transcript_11351/g.27793 Transcript_11351/m.27793 type:complete len:116 (-) Transcript_11351:2066-2413(-)
MIAPLTYASAQRTILLKDTMSVLTGLTRACTCISPMPLLQHAMASTPCPQQAEVRADAIFTLPTTTSLPSSSVSNHHHHHPVIIIITTSSSPTPVAATPVTTARASHQSSLSTTE